MSRWSLADRAKANLVVGKSLGLLQPSPINRKRRKKESGKATMPFGFQSERPRSMAPQNVGASTETQTPRNRKTSTYLLALNSPTGQYSWLDPSRRDSLHQIKSMLSTPDYLLIGFYFVFIFSLGFIFKSANSNASDYFRGGGSLMWWMVGASAFMQQFSALTFTAVAGKAFRDGSIVIAPFIANALGFFINYLWTAKRFRQMRVITPVEAVRDRFGRVNEQVFTWLQLPVNVIYAGIWLNGLAVFVAAVFDVDIVLTILLIGSAVVFMSVTGGAWAVVASDFVQMLLIMIISVAAAFLAFYHPAIGGISGFIEKAPAHYFNWNEGVSSKIIWLWVFALFLKQSFGLNGIMDSSRYLCAKDGHHARKAALLACVLMLVGPVFWFIPPMAAGILESNLDSTFPNLIDSSDASYAYMGSLTLPVGMMGLLLCGIFAATMSSMDSALNRNSGILVQNVYQVYIAKDASPSKLLSVGRLTSTILGVMIIAVAISLSKLTGFTLYDIMWLYAGLVALPTIIPLTLGVFIKRTPAWSAWSTVLVGFAFSLVVVFWLKPETISWLAEHELNQREVNDFRFFAGTVGNLVICTLWFAFTKLFYERSTVSYKTQLDDFFQRIETPIDFAREHGQSSDSRQGLVLGSICLLYAGVLGLTAVFVSEGNSKTILTYAGVAGLMGLIGYALWRSSRKKQEEGSEEKKVKSRK